MASPLRQRDPRICNREYLGFIAAIDHCVVCWRAPVECAHVRYAEACPDCGGDGFGCVDCQNTGWRYGKRPVGAGEKPSDWWTLPLCPDHHRNGPDAQHARGEREWWAARGIDPLELCVKLQDAFNTLSRAQAIEAGRRAVMEAA